MSSPLSRLPRELILGVGGGISAYKSCDLLRRLQEHGFLVSVVPTRNSYNFVGKATWEALSGREVHDDLWNSVQGVPHVALAKRAEVVLIAPATADLISKIATGRADDMLTNILSASTAPIVLVPAMHTEMWLNPSTVGNVATLRSRGIIVVEPENGKLTSGDVGPGRYPEISTIIEAVFEAVGRRADLLGKRVLISAGGTREAIDDVRYIGNISSGKQGIALAVNAASRGARVQLVLANRPDFSIEGINIFHVKSAMEMLDVMNENFEANDIVIFSAAVSDVRPRTRIEGKLEKGALGSIELVENPDIAATLGARKKSQVLIGFAAQASSDAKDRGRQKMHAKKFDAIYINDVSAGKIFGKDETEGTILMSNGDEIHIDTMSKMTLAEKLLSIALDKLG